MSGVTNSTLITNIIAGAVQNAKKFGGEGNYADFCAVAADRLDTVGDQIRLCVVPKTFVPASVMVRATDMDTNGTPTLAWDIGLAELNDDGTVTVRDADCFGSAVTIGQAADLVGTQVIGESGVVDLTELGNKNLYELCGDTGKLSGNYVVILTITNVAATAAAGTVNVVLQGR